METSLVELLNEHHQADIERVKHVSRVKNALFFGIAGGYTLAAIAAIPMFFPDFDPKLAQFYSDNGILEYLKETLEYTLMVGLIGALRPEINRTGDYLQYVSMKPFAHLGDYLRSLNPPQ